MMTDGLSIDSQQAKNHLQVAGSLGILRQCLTKSGEHVPQSWLS